MAEETLRLATEATLRLATEDTLRLVVRTPQASVLDERVTSLRVPTDTGQVGLRPRSEPAALVVEPGLVLATRGHGIRFVATAGGLLRCDGEEALLLTPLAVVGESAEAVGTQLESALATPSADLELRAVLQRLEKGILQELRRSTSAEREGGPRD
jgi:F0F1-type ATP synthase epsilon subunit